MIAGAKAEQGASLAEVKAAAEKAVRNIRTMGVAMTPCILPAVGKPGFQIADDEIEIGMGIHGEQGVETTKIKSAKEIAVQKLLEEKGIKAYRTFVGNYCTAIDMTGASVTLMKLDDELKELLDAPCDTPALKI